MNETALFLVRSISVVDLTGADAGKILHNLTTNDVQALGEGQSLETFVTEVRGKVLHHVVALRLSNGFRMVGPSGQEAGDSAEGDAISYSQRLVNHCDRYTIREDAAPAIRDDDFVALVASPQVDLAGSGLSFPTDHWQRCHWLGEGTHFALIEPNQIDSVTEGVPDAVQDEFAFHLQRVRAGFPWYGTDFNEKNLPQEADRDAIAINFNKGCYLGQETVARLDALGQVQKKLVRWKVDSKASAGDGLTHDGKTVGRLTSVATETEVSDKTEIIALGMARRSHFDPGSIAIGNAGQTNEYKAEVAANDV